MSHLGCNSSNALLPQISYLVLNPVFLVRASEMPLRCHSTMICRRQMSQYQSFTVYALGPLCTTTVTIPSCWIWHLQLPKRRLGSPFPSGNVSDTMRVCMSHSHELFCRVRVCNVVDSRQFEYASACEFDSLFSGVVFFESGESHNLHH